MFAIENTEGMGLGKYYMGKYIVQGSYYLSFTDDVKKAKKYTSLKRAETGLKSIQNYVGFMYSLDIVEVDNENN